MKVTLLAPRTQADHELVAVLAELVAARVLRPFIVIDSVDHGRWVETNGLQSPQTIDELLGRLGRIELVRLLAFSLESFDTPIVSSEDLTALRDAISAAHIAVTLGSISSCVAGGHVPADAMGVFWNFNLVVVPQESLGEEGTYPVMIADPNRLMMTVLPVVALVGGLWRWTDAGPLDSMQNAGGNNVQRVRLARAVTRVVDAGDLTARAVGNALMTGVRLPPPPDCVPHGEPAQAIARMVDVLAPAQGVSPIGFSYQPFVQPDRPSPKSMGAVAAIKYFLRELVDELRPAPRAAFQRKIEELRVRVESAVQGRTFGADSEIVVRLRRPGDAFLLLDQDARRREIDRLPSMKSYPLVPSPTVWDTLVSVVLAAADGSQMPKGFEALQPDWTGKRAVIGDLSLLAAPFEPDTQPGLTLSSHDFGSLGITSDGDANIQSNDAAVLGVLADLEAVRTVSPVGGPLPPPVVSSASDDTPAGTEAPQPSAPTDTDARTRIDKWIGGRQHTLMWRLASRLTTAQGAALGDLERTQVELDAISQQIDAAKASEVKRRKSFIRRSLLILGMMVVLAALTAVGLFVVSTMIGLIFLAILVLWMIGGIIAILRMAADRVRWKHRLDDLAQSPALLFARRQTAADEYRRLSNVYQQYLDWADVIAAAIHRPWGNVQTDDVQPWMTQTGVLSFSVGKPVVAQNELAAASIGVAQRVATQGWLTKAFRERRQKWVDWYKAMTAGIAGLSPIPEEDSDTSTDVIASIPASHGMDAIEIKQPRQQFRDQYCAGQFADDYRASQIAQLRSDVGNRDPAKLIDHVDADVTGLDGRTAHDFFRPPVESEAIPAFDHGSFVTDQHRVATLGVESWIGISPSIGASLPPGRHTHQIIEPDDRLLLASFRLDLSDAVPAADCPLVAAAASKSGQDDDETGLEPPRRRG